MKETVNANIGGRAFTIDRDAYDKLSGYISDIARRLSKDETEAVADIESRIAEILCERITSPMMVVTIDMVAVVMARIGRPEDFGTAPDGTADSSTTAQQPQVERPRLRRSLTNRSIAGICGGIADYFEIDTTLVRLLTLMLILFGGLSIWVYIILWIVIPEEKLPQFDMKNKTKKQ